jgi:two-component system cell cycle response regulator
VPTISVVPLPASSTVAPNDRPRLLTPRRVAIVGAAWIGIFAVLVLALPADGWPARILVNGVYLIPIVIGEVLVIRAARKVPPPRRRFWIVMAIAGPLTLAGELVVSWHHLVIGDEPPLPGLPDVFFISYYVVLLAALIFGLRPARQLQSWRAALDASIVAAVVAFISYDLLISPQLGGGVTSTQLVGLAYPAMDVAMLVALISLALASFGHIPWSLRLVALGIVTATMGDDALTYLSIHSVNVEVGWLKIAWTTTSVLYGAAAWQACREPAEVRRQSGRSRGAGLALVAAGVALTVSTLVADLIIEDGLHLEAAILVLYVFAAVLVRLWVTAREREAVSRELADSLRLQRRMANTDELTGLANRRRADATLAELAGSAGPDRALGVLVVDLDHFKEVNDRLGHPAGDAVLVDVAARLRGAVRPGDLVTRYGGEEFVVVVDDVTPTALHGLAERCRAAIGDEPFAVHGHESVIVTASVGGAALPGDASDLGTLLHIADRALYTAKAIGRNRAHVGARPAPEAGDDLLERGSVLNFLQALADRIDTDSGSAAHTAEAARLAGEVADRLGVDAVGRWRAVAAARFHDLGKVAVPRQVLAKRGALNPDEWRLVHDHPERGAQILELTSDLRDVAPVIRQHHEHYDGRGYPDGRSAEEILLEARIVAVCDAWAAMRADRPYRRALTEPQALAELHRCAGSQFDPNVVRAFTAVVRAPVADRAAA